MSLEKGGGGRSVERRESPDPIWHRLAAIFGPLPKKAAGGGRWAAGGERRLAAVTK